MQGRLKKILYIEDDPIIAELAIMAMQEFGDLTVQHCQSGREAIDSLESSGAQLVLLDVMMPEMDGVETLKRLRTQDGGANLPAIFMSARIQAHEKAQYLEAGACGVIAKPFDPMTLANTLQEIWRDTIAA